MDKDVTPVIGYAGERAGQTVAGGCWPAGC